MGERGQPVEKPGRRHRQADARRLGQEAGDRRGIAGVLLVAERNDTNPRRLRHPAKIGDRDAGHIVNGVDAVELERLDDEMKAVRQFALCRGGFRLGFNSGLCHGESPFIFSLTSVRGRLSAHALSHSR